MNSHANEGLIVSVLIYFMAMFAGLALFVGPVLWANGPTIEKNIAPGNVSELLASRYRDSNFPVAKLKHEKSLNPAHLVELNARVKEPQNSRQPRHAGRARLGQKVRPAKIANSFAAPVQRQYHGSSSALSAQY